KSNCPMFLIASNKSGNRIKSAARDWAWPYQRHWSSCMAAKLTSSVNPAQAALSLSPCRARRREHWPLNLVVHLERNLVLAQPDKGALRVLEPGVILPGIPAYRSAVVVADGSQKCGSAIKLECRIPGTQALTERLRRFFDFHCLPEFGDDIAVLRVEQQF